MGGRWFRVFYFLFSHFLSTIFIFLLLSSSSFFMVSVALFFSFQKQTNKHTLDFFRGILGCGSSSWASFFTLVYIFTNEYLFMFFAFFFNCITITFFFALPSHDHVVGLLVMVLNIYHDLSLFIPPNDHLVGLVVVIVLLVSWSWFLVLIIVTFLCVPFSHGRLVGLLVVIPRSLALPFFKSL